MKNITKIFVIAACATSMTLTSCIEETVPTSTVTDEVLKSSTKASEALVWAMPAFFNKYGTYSSDYAYDWGYGSMMHIRDVLTADQAVVSHGYNWYDSWSTDTYLGPRYVTTYFTWAYFWQAIATTNNTIGALDGVTEGTQAGYLGAAYAFRAFFYLDAARMYEFMPNDATSGEITVVSDSVAGDSINSINYLTIPKVTQETTEAEFRNNPRLTHTEMYNFILSDLDKAEELIVNYSRSQKTLPDLACVYGLKARLYLWNASYLEEIGEDATSEYALAEKAARAAIDQGVNTPLTADEWLNTTSGFNSLASSSWMWGASASTDDDVVQSGILNWTSWMSNEATFGYAAAGPFSMIGSDLYNQISDEDFRKLSFKAPNGGALSGKEPLIITDKADENYIFDDMPEYASIKFRPGNGDVAEYKVGAACAYPVMRIEEMYLIEAEAAAHQDAARGIALLNTFMQTYRYSSFNAKAGSVEAAVEAVFLQKRIELWGEGQLFFDYKRLNKAVDRTTSTNWDGSEMFNTDLGGGNPRPAWMNLCIPTNEVNNNTALKNFENPDPSNAYTPAE